MPPTAPSPGTSSGRTTVSEVIARRARHEASLNRQALRQIDKKAGERVWVDDYPRARPARTRPTRRAAAVPEPDASPFRRGLQYLCDNFLPAFLTPKKKKSTKVGAFAPKQRAPLVLQDGTSPLTEENLLRHNSGTPYGSKGGVSDKGIGSSFSSTGTPTPVGRHNQADALIAVENGEDYMVLDDGWESMQELYERVARWQASGDFEPPLEQTKLPNPFAAAIVIWPSVRVAEEKIRMVRLQADRLLYKLFTSETVVRSCLDTMAHRDEYLYVEHLDEKFRKKYGRQPARRQACFEPYALGEGPAAEPARFFVFGATKSPDPFVAHFARYELEWINIKEGLNEPLTLKTTPWPLFTPPNSFADITLSRVQDFFRFAKVGYTSDFLFKSTEELQKAAEYELHQRWRADVFVSLISGRIQDEREAAMILHCSGIVEGALQQLASLQQQ